MFATGVAQSYDYARSFTFSATAFRNRVILRLFVSHLTACRLYAVSYCAVQVNPRLYTTGQQQQQQNSVRIITARIKHQKEHVSLELFVQKYIRSILTNDLYRFLGKSIRFTRTCATFRRFLKHQSDVHLLPLKL